MKTIASIVVLVAVASVSATGMGGEMMLGNGNFGQANVGCMGGHCGGYVDQHYGYAPYQFGYAFHDDHYGSQQAREEVADGHGGVKGSYSFVDGHGIKRTVEYVADKAGFRAVVKTNEPGTKTSNPANAVYLSSAPEMLHYGPEMNKGYGGLQGKAFVMNAAPMLSMESGKFGY